MERETRDVSIGKNIFGKQVRRVFAGCAAILAVLSLASPAHGAEYSLITNDFRADAIVRAAELSLPNNFPPSRRSRPVTLTPFIAAEKGLSHGDTLTLNLFNDKVYTAHIDKVSVNINGTVTVRGRIEGYPLGYVLISTTGDSSLGSVRIPEKDEYYVIQSQPDVQQHYLLEVDVTQLKKLNDGPTPIPPLIMPHQESAEKEMPTATVQGGPLDPATIDVMIVYTPAALNRIGGLNNINSFIGNTIANANLVLNNSNTTLTVDLVYSAEVSYTESGSSYTDLDQLTYTGGGYSSMDEVHTWRNQYGADLVVLFADVEDVGGLGWLLNTTSGLPEYGFSLTSVRWGTWAIDDFVTIHEMGHNMGCHHYKWQTTQPGPGLFSYSAGWRWVANSVNYCSVMSYGQDGSYSGTRLGYFSNPDVYNQGVATGNAADGDNARTIRETKNIIAAYRPTAPPYNDMFANAITMSGTSWQATGRNICATKESGEPSHAGNAGGASVWWYWTAPFNGQMTIDTFGSSFDTLLAVYTGTSFPLTEIASNDDSGSPQSQVTFTAISGTTYRIAVDGHDGATGNITLNLYAAGEIVAWGSNDNGESTVPLPNTGFVAIAAGWNQSLGLKQDGSIAAWGNNANGQCTVPSPNTDFVAIASNWEDSLGLKQNSSLVAWGNNNSGQCTIPLPNTGFVAIADGGDHSLGLKTNGSIVAWGSNYYGQRTVPLPNTGFKAIAAGAWHSLGLKQDGSILAWGDNGYGQCTLPSPNTDFVAIAAGMYHSLGLKADGSIVAWGAGQPGQSDYPNYGQCILPSPNTGFVAIAAGHTHSLGLKQDGSIAAWGDDWYGQCTVPLPNTAFTAISAGGNHSLGLKGCQYALTVNSSGTESVGISSFTGHEGTTNYTYTVTSGTTILLTAPSTAGGKIFAGWTGDVTSSNQTIFFLINGDKTVIANFLPPVELTMAVSPSEGGTTTPPIGTSSFENGSTIPIEAHANAGYGFLSWTAIPQESAVFGNPNIASTTVILSDNAAITANFNAQPLADINATSNIVILNESNSITLDANSSTDDGLPNPPGTLTYHWQKVSGPNTCLIKNPNDVNTVVVFSGCGSFEFSLTISDGQLQDTQSVNVSVVLDIVYVSKSGNDITGSGTINNPFASITKGMDIVQDDGRVIVLPGTYYENVNFDGKSAILSSVNPDDMNVVETTIIDANNSGSAVTFDSGEDSNSILAGFTITGGNTELGGGIYIDGASPIIEKNIITGNSSNTEGGGIYCQGGSATIRYNKISDNYSVFIGGVSFESSFAVLQNNLIVGNSADYDSGIACVEGQPKIINNTISGNAAVYVDDSSGLVIASSSLSPIISNNIIAFNYGAPGVADFGGFDPNYFSYNDVNGHPNGDYVSLYLLTPNQTGVNGNISEDPLFADTDANDYHLLPESLLIDAGDPNSDWSNEPRPNGGRINIGAYGNTSEASCSAAGDITWDKKVDFKDFAKLAFYWLQNEPSVDIAPLVSGDNIVDIKDLSVLADHWLEGQ
ncbi:MAG: M12 family metallo-peptidase [Phycisphaerae bacterium]|jgi:hypothetical protein